MCRNEKINANYLQTGQIRGLFYDADNNSDYIASNGTMIRNDELQRIRKQTIVAYFEIIIQYSPGSTYEEPQDSWNLTEFLTRNLPNIYQQRYRYADLLGRDYCVLYRTN
jgi:hypothetical protein